MRKIRVYLDTSVISMIDAPHIPEIEAVTKEFFQIMRKRCDEFQTYSSPIGRAEIKESPPEKGILFAALLKDIDCITIPEDEKRTEYLVNQYLQAGFLTQTHIDDLTHIAYAVIVQCDYIVSWNMKHIVREKTTRGVHAVNRDNNYHSPSIVTPRLFIRENQ